MNESTDQRHALGPGLVGEARPRVLMLTHRAPCPPDRGDRIRAYHLLRAIAGRFDVTLATLADEPIDEPDLVELKQLTTDLLIRRVRPMRRRASMARALLTGHAITPAAMYDRALINQLADLHRARPFNTVLTYCTGMIGYAQAVLTAGGVPPRHVLDLVDVDSVKWSRYAESTRGPLRLVYAAESRRLRGVEAGRVVPFDAVTVITADEQERYRQHVTTSHLPVVVGNGVDTGRFSPAGDDSGVAPVIVFTGVLSYKPNVDAAVWFARRAMPRVLAAVPNARFDIVGKSPAPAVRALDGLPGVRVVGPVADTAENLRGCALAVAPLAIAPGVQNKVLEAMACGRAVVCSSAAAAGIEAQPGRHLLVADTEEDVASRVVRLLLNPGERKALGGAARSQVVQHYSWDARLSPMIELLDPSAPPTVAGLRSPARAVTL